MFQQFQLAGDDRTKVAVHGEVKGGVVVFYCIDVVAHFYFCSQFFFDLPFKGFLWAFSWLYLAPGIFPAVLELTVAPLGGKQLVVLDNDGCYNMDGFHTKSIQGKAG